MVHVSDAVMQGFHRILICTVDRHVVLAVATVKKLEKVEICIAELLSLSWSLSLRSSLGQI